MKLTPLTIVTPFLLAPVLAVALLGACSSAGPGGEEATGQSAAEALISCTAPFTYNQHECFQGVNHPYCANGCFPVTDPPNPSNMGIIDSVATPIAPPTQLATMGCTVGLHLDGCMTLNVWACSNYQPQTNLGAYPTCADSGPIVRPCEFVLPPMPTVPQNAYVGSPHENYQLVIEQLMLGDGGTDLIGGSCKGGCILPP